MKLRDWIVVQNLRQVWKEWQTRDRLMAEFIVDLFPMLKKRLER